MHINISRKLNVLVQVASIDEKAMLDYCQSEVSVTIAEMPQVEARIVPYFFFFVTAATDRPSTAGCSQTVQIIHAGL